MKMIESLEQMLSSLASRRSGLAICLVGHAGIGKTHTAGLILKKLPLRSSTVHATITTEQFLKLVPRASRLPNWVTAMVQRLEHNEITLLGAADAVAAWLVSLAPFVLHLEDIHEANPEQQAFWNSIAKAIKAARGVGVLATSRGVLPSEFTAMPLEFLSSDAAETLLVVQLGAALPEAAKNWILSRAGGNPLFLLEFQKFLIRQGSLWNDGTQWHWRVPDTSGIPNHLEALIEHMLYPIVANEVLAQVFALKILIADSFELWQPASQLSKEAFEGACLTLQNHGVLNNQLQIAHPLFSEVFFQTQQHHLQFAARQLLQVAPPIMTAKLLKLAQVEASEARMILEKAIVELEEQQQVRQALYLKVQVLELMSSPERASLAFDLALVLVLYDPKAAIGLLDMAIQAPDVMVAALLKKASWLATLGLFEDGKRTLELLPKDLTPEQSGRKILTEIIVYFAKRELISFQHMVALWENHPEVHDLARFPEYRLVSHAYMELGNTKMAWHWIRVVESLPSNSLTAQAMILNTLCNLHKAQKQYPEAIEVVKRAITLLEPRIEAGQADINELRQCETAWANLASSYIWVNQFQQAVMAAQKGIELTIRFNLGDRMTSELNLADALLQLGRFDEAEQYFLEHLPTVLIGYGVFIPIIYLHLTMLYSQRAGSLDQMLALKYARETMRAASVNAEDYKQAKHKLIELEARFGNLEIAKKLVAEIELETGFMPWQQAFILERQNSQGAAVKALSEARDALQFNEYKNFIELELVRLTQDRTLALDLEQRLKKLELGGLLFVLHRYMPDLEPVAPVLSPVGSFRIANLGSLLFERDGVNIKYKAEKGRDLLGLLSEMRLLKQSEISQLELLDLLYPNLDESAAIASLQQLIYRLRNTLGQNIIVRTPTGYALGAEVQTDAEVFLQTADSSLWRGVWLADVGGGRDSLARNRIYQALTTFIENTILKAPLEAARLALIWLEAEPYEVQAVMLARDAFLAAGDALGAERVYTQAQVRFHEVGVQLNPQAMTSR
jgi:tetratricopeptide (TPR) repeat protein